MTTGLLSFKMLHQQPPRPKKACFKSGPLAIAFNGLRDDDDETSSTGGGLPLSPDPSYDELIEMRQVLMKNFKDQYDMNMSSPPPLLLLDGGDGDDCGPSEAQAMDGDGGGDNGGSSEAQAMNGDDDGENGGSSEAQAMDGDDDGEIEEISVEIPAKEKKKRVRKTKTAAMATVAEAQPKDNQGRFAAKRLIDGAEVPAAKRQKKDPDTKKYVAAGEFLLSKRYLLPGLVPKENTELEPVAFDEFLAMEEASEDIEEYLRACVKLEINGRHRDLQNIIDEGKAIDFYFKVNQAKKNNAGKKPSAVELYRQLSKVLDMPGSEEMSARWCQRRRALAKISEVLNLTRYGYRCSTTEIINFAPQIERANKLKLVNFE